MNQSVRLTENGRGAIFTIDGREIEVYFNAHNPGVLTVTTDGGIAVIPASSNTLRIQATGR